MSSNRASYIFKSKWMDVMVERKGAGASVPGRSTRDAFPWRGQLVRYRRPPSGSLTISLDSAFALLGGTAIV